jgi:hypothetical protein
VPVLNHGLFDLTSVAEADAGPGVDCAVVCTNHSVFDYASLPTRFPVVVDTRNALKGVTASNVFRL